MNRAKTIKLVCAAILFGIVIIGCMTAVKYPKTFIQGLEPVWASIEIPVNIETETVWQNAVAALAKKYELATLSKEAGNIKTAWINTSEGKDKTVKDYRVRGIIQFSNDWKKVDVKTEANYLKGNEWVLGYDTGLLESIKTDIMTVIGVTPK